MLKYTKCKQIVLIFCEQV